MLNFISFEDSIQIQIKEKQRQIAEANKQRHEIISNASKHKRSMFYDEIEEVNSLNRECANLYIRINQLRMMLLRYK